MIKRMGPKYCDFITLFCATTISVLLMKHKKLQDEILIEIDRLNNTKNANQSILIYNRVPKVSLQK